MGGGSSFGENSSDGGSGSGQTSETKTTSIKKKVGSQNKKAREVWDSYYEKALKDSRKLTADIMHKTLNGELHPDDTDGQQQLVLKHQASVAQSNTAYLKALWGIYDSDQSGDLDFDEIETVIGDALVALRKWMPRMHVEIATVNVRMMRAKFTPEQIREIESVLEDIIPAIEKQVHRWLDRRLANMEKITAVMKSKLGSTNDQGVFSVTREDFLANFSTASSEIINPEDLGKYLDLVLFSEWEDPTADDDEYDMSGFRKVPCCPAWCFRDY